MYLLKLSYNSYYLGGQLGQEGVVWPGVQKGTLYTHLILQLWRGMTSLVSKLLYGMKILHGI